MVCCHETLFNRQVEDVSSQIVVTFVNHNDVGVEACDSGFQIAERVGHNITRYTRINVVDILFRPLCLECRRHEYGPGILLA